MNRERRNLIYDVVKRLESIKDNFEEIMSDIEEIQTDEDCSFESMPDNLKESERGELAQMAIDELGSAFDTAETVFDEIAEIIESLETASE